LDLRINVPEFIKGFRSGVFEGVLETPVKDWKYSLNLKAFIIDRDE